MQNLDNRVNYKANISPVIRILYKNDKRFYFHFIYPFPSFSVYIDRYNSFKDKYEHVKNILDTLSINNPDEKQNIKDILSGSDELNR